MDGALREIPAIALTAYAGDGDRQRALAAGFQIHLAKPVEPRDLATVVAAVARRRWSVNNLIMKGERT